MCFNYKEEYHMVKDTFVLDEDPFKLMASGRVPATSPSTGETLAKLGVAALGIGFVGAGLYAGWFVAGILAIKLGLLGFWWHLLSWAVVGGFIAAPFIKLAQACFSAIS